MKKTDTAKQVKWLRALASKGVKGGVDNVDARALGRIADEIERLEAERNSYKRIAEDAAKVERRNHKLRANLDEAYMLLEDAVEYVEDPQFNNDICEYLNRGF